MRVLHADYGYLLLGLLLLIDRFYGVYVLKVFNKFFLIILTTYLISCASSNPPPKTFNQFLYNQSSMTKQLESLDNNFQVIVLNSGMAGDDYKRIVSLTLSNIPVIVAISQAKTGSPYFVDLLKNADTKPIGKILFARNSGVIRDLGMKVDQIYLNHIGDNTVRNYIASLGYTNKDVIYKRTSIFRKKAQYMQLDEYVLPSIHIYLH
ncbi:MAG: hypothetical protein K0R14_454 [Burkholderiales bacterium]|nr:hypothetical protein [Burkholderiales bacterium]